MGEDFGGFLGGGGGGSKEFGRSEAHSNVDGGDVIFGRGKPLSQNTLLALLAISAVGSLIALAILKR